MQQPAPHVGLEDGGAVGELLHLWQGGDPGDVLEPWRDILRLVVDLVVSGPGCRDLHGVRVILPGLGRALQGRRQLELRGCGGEGGQLFRRGPLDLPGAVGVLRRRMLRVDSGSGTRVGRPG